MLTNTENVASGFAMSLFLIWFLIQGVIGSFQYHNSRKQAKLAQALAPA